MFRDSEDLRELLRFRLQKRGWNYEDLARATNIASERFSKYFRGKKPNLTQHEFIRMAKALGVELDINIKITD
jgi:transcriptional regulator with XRE-family HTH domain